MNVIVPLGGLGSRFQKEGYTRPKPFVRVLGKEMILWVLDNLNLGPDDSLVIVYNPAFLSMDVFMTDIVKAHYPNVVLVELAGPTRGAAETVLLGLEGLEKSLLDRPCMLCDGDCFYTADIVSMYRAVSSSHNATFTFHDTQPKPIYSYVTTDESNDVIDIKEKVKISDNANTGCYCFRNGNELATYCKKIINTGQMQLSQDQQGEFYTSGVIKAMLTDKMPCKMLQLKRNSFHVLGTPSQLKEFCAKWKTQPAMTFAFSIDGTLLNKNCEPIQRNMTCARSLAAQGHTILLTSVGQPSAAKLQTIKEQGVPVEFVDDTRPHADFYVDQGAIDSMLGDINTYIGFYTTSVKTTLSVGEVEKRASLYKSQGYSSCHIAITSGIVGLVVGYLFSSYRK